MKFLASLTTYVVCYIGFAKSQGGWVQVWQDEFNNQESISNKWIFDVNCDGGGNNELQCYTNSKNNARKENGHLIIEAHYNSSQEGKKFTSARINSRVNWLRGKFEIRARLPKGKHLWPAIWMMPAPYGGDGAYGGWPRSGEMDIMEYRGQRTNEIEGTLHFGDSATNKNYKGSGETKITNIEDFSLHFHTFGFIWDEDKVQWLVDDKPYHTEHFNNIYTPGPYSAPGEPFDKSFYLILNLAVGGDYFDDKAKYGELEIPGDVERWPKKTLEIDWVRVYRKRHSH